jgi:hypothetical protein
VSTPYGLTERCSDSPMNLVNPRRLELGVLPRALLAQADVQPLEMFWLEPTDPMSADQWRSLAGWRWGWT